MSADSIVRELENVIDTGYRTLPAFIYPKESAVYGLLATYDSYIMSELEVRRLSPGPFSVGQVQVFKGLAEGLVWAMRWMTNGVMPFDVTSMASGQLLHDAHELIEYGAKYYGVSMMYSYFSRGAMEVCVDSEAKRVRFDYKPGYVNSQRAWGLFDDVLKGQLPDRPVPKATTKRQVGALFESTPHHLMNGHILIDEFTSLASDCVREYSSTACASQFIFDEKTVVGGFNIGEFNRFWVALWSWSSCCIHLYLQHARSGVPQEECMPTQVIACEEFLATMAILSGLSDHTVRTITSVLSYDCLKPKSDIYLQPFIRSEQTIAWSPLVVQNSGFQRNLLKLMARTPSLKPIADNVIGGRELALLDSLTAWLEQKGWSVERNRKLPGNQPAEIDLLGVTWHYPEQILIVEAKALLDVDDLNEVRSATLEMQHGQRQIQRSINILRQMSVEKRAAIFPNVEWEKVRDWYGVVVTPDTEPGFDLDHSQIPAASFSIMRSQLRARDWQSPSRIWGAMLKKEWQAIVREGTIDHSSIELAGITFEIPRIHFPE